MFEEDHHIICYALNMWANYIETADPTLGKESAISSGDIERIKTLSQSQLAFVAKLRGLSADALNKKINLTENCNV